MSYDSINSLFELSGGFFVALHIYRLWRDKEAKGVSLVALLFFSTWGCWNLVYYAGIAQPCSLYASIGIVLANMAWVGLILYYRFVRRKYE